MRLRDSASARTTVRQAPVRFGSSEAQFASYDESYHKARATPLPSRQTSPDVRSAAGGATSLLSRSCRDRREGNAIHLLRPQNISSSRIAGVFCSQCGMQRLEFNHWFIAWTERSGRRFCFMLMDAEPALAKQNGVQTLCGQRCLHQAIQKYTDSIPKQ